MSNADSEANATAIPQRNASEKLISKPPPPFPQQFQKNYQDGQFRRFLDVMKKLHINIPLVEDLEQMPNYVIAILKNKIPHKLKDPGSFKIPISIGGREVGKAIYDLGASISLMPMSIFKKFGIGEARHATLTLQLADRSMVHPEGKIEDVLVQVDKLIFPTYFIILDYEEESEVLIILGRPFLDIGRTLIDVEKGEFTIRAQDEQVTFKVFNPIHSPNEVEACLAISASNSKMFVKIHEKHRKRVKKKVPFEEIEKGGEPWKSKEKGPSHPQKLVKKKKHSRKP
ncbi:uncharacterized protein LOC133806805 [Humulus lupulus]|uniref:uncharacterized protein LOC133806805 n=1 Tax=Humulus lupulus TaxID=3486 RepID=UPI002B407EB0|nr:uncharacterized protein LOC133806805 [Humulus lupulus]